MGKIARVTNRMRPLRRLRLSSPPLVEVRPLLKTPPLSTPALLQAPLLSTPALLQAPLLSTLPLLSTTPLWLKAQEVTALVVVLPHVMMGCF